MAAPLPAEAPGRRCVLAAALPSAAAGWRAGAAQLQPACMAAPVHTTTAPFIQKFRHCEISRAHWLLLLLNARKQRAGASDQAVACS
jgi:hypothetical protein